MSKPMFPELRAVQRVLNALEPFTPQEQKRICIVACAMLGYDWMTSFVPSTRARRLLTAAQETLRKVS